MKKKKTEAASASAQLFLNIESISDGLIFSKDRWVFGFLSIHGADNKLVDDTERESVMRRTAAVLEREQEIMQIISVPRTVDVADMVSQLRQMELEAEQETLKMLLEGEISAMQQLMDDGAKESFIILKLWERAAPGADTKLIRRLQNMANELAACKVTARRLNSSEVLWLCKLYTNLELYIPQQEAPTDIPMIAGEKRRFSSRTAANQEAQMLNSIAPSGGFHFGINRFQIGNVLARCYGAVRYPSEVSYGWLVPLVSCLDAITCVTYYPGKSADLGDALSKAIRRSSVSALDSKDAREQKQMLRRVEGADKMLDDMDARNMAIGHISLVVMPFTDDEEQFQKTCDKVLGLCGGGHLKMKGLGNLQKDAFKHLSPFYTNQTRVDNMLKQIIPLNTMVGGEPMTVTLLRDDGGVYFGRTTEGAPISVNLFFRGNDRTNSNLVTLGTAGSGKSTAMKHLLESMYMMGVKVLIIDPEREYRDLCRNLGGAWLDVGGGFAKINPLDIRATPEDAPEDDDKLYADCPNAMAMHIKTLLVRIRLQIPSLTDLQCALLQDSLIQLYSLKGITFETPWDELKEKGFPVMKDWYELLLELQKTDERYQNLATLLQSMAVGADSFLWNGQTNIQTDAQIVCFDTNRLQNFSQETQAACYFNILSLCWDYISANRSEPIILFLDEGHIALDPRLPEVGLYLRNLAKRIRKYEGGLWFVSQSSADMLHDSIRMSGQAIVDNAAYKILFHCDAKNLQDTVDLFQLTPAEAKLLSNLEQKNALSVIGSTHHIRTIFEIPQYKLDLMGQGGGR